MARYGKSSGYSGSRSGGYGSHRSSSGSRSFSSAQAHQHVGQSFGGYTKKQSSSSGNFYMAKDGKNK